MIASLVFCTGPLTILGSLNDGLGIGADQLFLKAALDGFAAIAFAASFGWGVAASALTVLVIQGGLTAARRCCSATCSPTPHLAALTADGGLLLVGVALRLLRIREIPVGRPAPGAGGGAPAADGSWRHCADCRSATPRRICRKPAPRADGSRVQDTTRRWSVEGARR